MYEKVQVNGPGRHFSMNSVLLGSPNSLMTCWAMLGNVQSCSNGLVPGVWCNTLSYNPIPHAV